MPVEPLNTRERIAKALELLRDALKSDHLTMYSESRIRGALAFLDGLEKEEAR